MTTWEAHFGEPFRGPLQPFGRLCYYLAKPNETHPLEPRTKPGFFCGWKLEFGARYRGGLLVLDYDFVRRHGFNGKGMRVIAQKEVHFPSELVFPFAEARKLAISRMEPLADLTIPTEPPKPVTPLPWSDEPLAIDSREPEVSEHAAPDDAVELPKHEKIGFKILPWRVRLYGGTLGCKACEETDISDKTPGGYYRRHTPKCRARFEELVKAEGAHNIRKVDTPEETPPELDTEEIPADEEDLEDPPLDDEDSTILDDILFGSPTEEDLRAEEELPESADLADELGLHDPPIPTPSSSSSGAWKKGEP